MTKSRNLYFFLIAIGLLFFLLIRYKYQFSALESDTGIYAYGAQEILRGNLPYKSFHVNKPPGILIIYAAAFKLLGESSYNIKLTATFSVLLSSLFVYLIAKKLLGFKYAVLSFVIFLFSLSLPFIQGIDANTEIFMITPLLFGLWLLYVDRSKKTLFISGFFLGISVLIKQTAIANFIATLVWFLFFKRDSFIKYFLIYTLGFLTPILSLVGYLLQLGIWQEFWFSNYVLNKAYISPQSLGLRWLIFPLNAVSENLTLWFYGLIGILTSSFLLIRNKSRKSNYLYLITLNFIMSLVFIQLTGRGYQHYYIQLVPFLSIFSIYGIKNAFNKWNKYFISSSLIFFLFISLFYLCKAVIFVEAKSLIETTRNNQRGKWFDQSIYVAEYINKFTDPGDIIYNLGRESQIYFYTKTRSPSRFINDIVFPYFPETLKETCDDLSHNKPKLIVNTLRPPRFPEKWAQYVWNEIKKCGNLEIDRKEEVYFAEVWFLK